MYLAVKFCFLCQLMTWTPLPTGMSELYAVSVLVVVSRSPVCPSLSAHDLDAPLPAGMPELYFAGFDNRDEYWTVLREYLFSPSLRYWTVLIHRQIFSECLFFFCLPRFGQGKMSSKTTRCTSTRCRQTENQILSPGRTVSQTGDQTLCLFCSLRSVRKERYSHSLPIISQRLGSTSSLTV